MIKESMPAEETSSIRVGLLMRHHIDAVTAVHCAAFPSSIFTRMGRGTVARYYDWQLTGPHDCAALGAWVGDELVGFCFGGVFRGAMSGFLGRNRTYLAFVFCLRPWLILEPLVREQIVGQLRQLRGRRVETAAASNSARTDGASGPSFGILSIAVAPSGRRRGIGRKLMAESEEVATKKGFRRMHLSVRAGNVEAVQFYEQLGWTKIDENCPDSYKMERLIPSIE